MGRHDSHGLHIEMYARLYEKLLLLVGRIFQIRPIIGIIWLGRYGTKNYDFVFKKKLIFFLNLIYFIYYYSLPSYIALTMLKIIENHQKSSKIREILFFYFHNIQHNDISFMFLITQDHENTHNWYKYADLKIFNST